MPLLKKTIMWGFFLAAMYFGGTMTQSGNNLLQGMGFMSIVMALICLYLVLKLVWGPLSHLMKLALCIGVVWFCAYSIGLFDGNTLDTFLSGTPATTATDDSASADNVVTPEELGNEMFSDAEQVNGESGNSQNVSPKQATPNNKGGLVNKIKEFLFGSPETPQASPQRDFNPFEYPEIKGYTKVLSGSILYLEGIKIKLLGIDAPDRDQVCVNRLGDNYDCGEMSMMWLQDWLSGKEVSCRILSKIEQGRATGSCFTDNNQYDVAAVVVNAGWAVAYTRTTDIYAPYEQQAMSARRGLWNGTFYTPWDWRKIKNRKFTIKIKHPGKQSGDGGFDFWGLF